MSTFAEALIQDSEIDVYTPNDLSTLFCFLLTFYISEISGSTYYEYAS